MKKILSIVAIVVVVALSVLGVSSLFGFNVIHSGLNKQITLSYSSDDFIAENYEDVTILMEKAGFTNIKYREIKDLYLGIILQDGSVDRVSIDGDTKFEANTKFDSDASVTITYHTYVDDEDNMGKDIIDSAKDVTGALNDYTNDVFGNNN